MSTVSNDCPYCSKPYLNFGDDDDEVELWIDERYNGERVIGVDPLMHGAHLSTSARSADATL